MKKFPSPSEIESTLPLLREGYTFGTRRFEQLHSDVFETRLMGRKAVVMRGREAARQFYDPALFLRQDALPNPLRHILVGNGGVQNLDGTSHLQRKAMLMKLMQPGHIADITKRADHYWRELGRQWRDQESIVLLDECYRIFSHAVCDWAGVPLTPDEADERIGDLADMFEKPASLGIGQWQGRRARARSERWAVAHIRAAREGRSDAAPDSPLRVVAEHRDDKGELLSDQVAAVELLNLLRPTVAVGIFVACAAVELHRHPQNRDRLANEETYLDAFVQEVRRIYSFFPQVAAFVKQDFDWGDYHFPQGRWVLLDLYATNRDPQCWDRPDTFDPDRFIGRTIGRYDFIPQGGGDPHCHHRCAGEALTVSLMKSAVRFLNTAITFEVPPQDLDTPPNRIPMRPTDRVRLTRVQRMSAAA